LGVALAGFLSLSPASQAARAETLALDVTYAYNGLITVDLPNGTPVGTTSGAPTVIPAGYYIVTLSQPGCVATPAFILQGPGVNIQDDLQSGEIVTDSLAADFQPNATYTWRDGSMNPPVSYTFTTSGNVVGTPPPPTTAAPVVTGSNKAEGNSSVVGAQNTSSGLAFAGSITANVSSGGRAALLYRGKAVSRLGAGRYTLTLNDPSPTSSFMLGTGSRKVLSLSGGTSSGKHSTSVELSAGKWYFATRPLGPKSYFTVVG